MLCEVEQEKKLRKNEARDARRNLFPIPENLKIECNTAFSKCQNS